MVERIAFWGWAILALAALLVNVLWYFLVIQPKARSTFLMALLQSQSCCRFHLFVIYSINYMTDKIEPVLVTPMIFHAVIFALFAIGSLITSVFSAVQLITRADSIDETMVVVIGGFYGSGLFLFLRTLKPKKLSFVATTYRVIIGLFADLAAFGGVWSTSLLCVK